MEPTALSAGNLLVREADALKFLENVVYGDNDAGNCSATKHTDNRD